MASHGFEITPHYLGMETAWKAEFKLGEGGRVLGVNSEMDALPGIGHGYGICLSFLPLLTFVI